MDKVIRTFKNLRNYNYEQSFEFTTLSIIFDPLRTQSEGNLGKILKYLNHVFVNGLPDLQGSYESCSAAKAPLAKEIKKVDKDFIKYCGYEKWGGDGLNQHYFVQQNFWKKDPQTIGTEVPVCLEPHATPTIKGWLGFIDILRIDEGKLQVLDFKPGAHKEPKYVGCQIKRYMYMLHRLTGLPKEKIEGYYFDHKNCYQIIN